MHKILNIAFGVCLGGLFLCVAVWAITALAHYICGDRYFTPSHHTVKKRLLDRLKNDAKETKVERDIKELLVV